MHEPTAEQNTGAGLEQAVRKGLHDVGQPLTALECRLYLAGMDGQTVEELREAIAEAQVECLRTIARVRDIQNLVHQFMEAGR